MKSCENDLIIMKLIILQGYELLKCTCAIHWVFPVQDLHPNKINILLQIYSNWFGTTLSANIYMYAQVLPYHGT